jgi:anthranilate phosphoribosyltransferase
MSLLPYLHQVADGRNLEPDEAAYAMQAILDGLATPPQIAGFLVALRMKGETSGELAGFARAMRSRVERVVVAPGSSLIDTCGTGGDGGSTFNISTIAALVVAGAGVRVAKHGNRSISSQCGSADLLEALGIRIALTPGEAAQAIEEIGIGFLFAPALHPAMKYAQPVRVDLKIRTVFNLLGPLTNPAGASAQLVGAPSVQSAELMAQALAVLGLTRGFVVHGSDGLDEITTTGSTTAFEVLNGGVTRHTIGPEDFGVPRAAATDLKGGSPETNAEIAREILRGKPGPRRDIVLVNAAAALVSAGKASDFRHGVALAVESIDSGAAYDKLGALANFASGCPRRAIA